MKIDKHIEIVCSTKTVLSSMSARSRNAALAVLEQRYARVGITIVNTLPDLEALVAMRPDLVFLGMKLIAIDTASNPQGLDKIWISDYLDEHGIAYTGSSQIAQELEMDKSLAKLCVYRAGLKTSRFHVVQHGVEPVREDIRLNFPVFIKPTDRGGGLGIDANSVAYNHEELCAKVRSIAAKLHSDALIEEFLPGREFSVAILKHRHAAEYSVMPIELVAGVNEDGERLLSGDMKASNMEVVLEVTDQSMKAKISTLALEVFHALGARDYGRIDIRLDADGTPQFLEANLIPSLIENYGSFPKACVLHLGLDYEPMIIKIAELGLARSVARNTAIFAQDQLFVTGNMSFQPSLVAPIS